MRLFVILFLMLGTMPALAAEQTACEKMGFLKEKPKGCPDNPNNKSVNEIVTCVENGKTFYLCKNIEYTYENPPAITRDYLCFAHDTDWDGGSDNCITVSSNETLYDNMCASNSSVCGDNIFCCSFDSDEGTCINTVCVNFLDDKLKSWAKGYLNDDEKKQRDNCTCLETDSPYDGSSERVTLCDCGPGAKHL